MEPQAECSHVFHEALKLLQVESATAAKYNAPDETTIEFYGQVCAVQCWQSSLSNRTKSVLCKCANLGQPGGPRPRQTQHASALFSRILQCTALIINSAEKLGGRLFMAGLKHSDDCSCGDKRELLGLRRGSPKMALVMQTRRGNRERRRPVLFSV